MTEHLKPKQHYIDLYDKHTVERCRRREERFLADDAPRDKKMSKEQVEAVKEWAHNLVLTMEKGERYLNRDKTIQDWMDEDRRKDDLYENAQAPEDIRCLTCRNRLTPTYKELWYEGDKPERVLFMYDCPNKCLPRRAFFNDGEEWRVKPHVCKNCSTPTTHTAEDDGKKLITTYTCSKCKHVETDEFEWSLKKEDEYDEHFATDRDRYCLSEEEGAKYREMKWSMEQAGKFMDEWKEKEKALAKRLEDNPKGFHREEAGYTCSICGGSTPAGDNWYDKWGLKCLVCQSAIDKGEIPASLAKNKDSWYTKYDFERYFSIKGQTLGKWVRSGILNARTVSQYGNGVHTQVFLIKDNEDFLPPKKLLESKKGRVMKDGKETIEMCPWYQCGDPHVILKGYKIMDYLRVIPPEEVAQREEEEKVKYEKRRAHREAVKQAKASRKARK